MRFLFPTLLLLLCSGSLFAQQGVQYTQFMFNKLGFNPAYAGSHERPCISCIHRSQWVGFDGAPTSQTVNFHTPLFGKRVGLGVSLQHDKIGPTDSYWANLAYAYRMQIEKGVLSIGIQGTLRRYAVDFNQTQAIVPSDLAVMEGSANKMLPNFGVGIYFNTEQFYVGWSVPHALSGNISLYDVLQSSADVALEEAHHYIMAGLKVDLSEAVKFKPAMLVKKVSDAPMDLDIHGSLVFNDRIGLGATYRLGGIRNSAGESVDLVAYLQFENGMRLGIAYDYTLSEVRRYNSGSFEVMLEQCIKGKNDKLTNPRFFF